MRSLTPARLRRARIVPLLAAVAGAVVALPGPAAATSQAGPAWTARVLPAGAATSRPTSLLESGVVVGTDVTTDVYGQGRPWLWSAVTGRRYLGLDGGSWAQVADAKSLLGVVGTIYREDATGAQRSTAVRWVGTRPVPLLPDATGDTSTDAGSARGDVVVRELTPGGAQVWLLSPGEPATDMGLLIGREFATSLNSSRQATVLSIGPGTIGPASFGVWDDGVRTGLVSGVRDWPACVADITESGVVAGSQYVFGTLARESALWRDGTRTVLPADGMSSAVACTADGVNEAGHVVGSLLRPIVRPGDPDPGSGPERAVLWRDGAIETLFTDTAERTVRPVGVNDRDVVVAQVGGTRPGVAVRSGGTWTDLPVPAGLSDVTAVGLNERGQVVGSGVRTAADGTTQRVPILWTPKS